MNCIDAYARLRSNHQFRGYQTQHLLQTQRLPNVDGIEQCFANHFLSQTQHL